MNVYLYAHSSDVENIISQCRHTNAKGVILLRDGYSAVVGEEGYLISGGIFSDQNIVIALPELTHILNVARRLAMRLPSGQMASEDPFLEFSITLEKNTIEVTGTSDVVTYTPKYQLVEPSMVERIHRIIEMESERLPDFAMSVNIFKQLIRRFKVNMSYHVEGEVLIVTGTRGYTTEEYFAGFSRVPVIPDIPRQSLDVVEMITKTIGEGIISFYLVDNGCHVVVERGDKVYARSRIELPIHYSSVISKVREQ